MEFLRFRYKFLSTDFRWGGSFFVTKSKVGIDAKLAFKIGAVLDVARNRRTLLSRLYALVCFGLFVYINRFIFGRRPVVSRRPVASQDSVGPWSGITFLGDVASCMGNEGIDIISILLVALIGREWVFIFPLIFSFWNFRGVGICMSTGACRKDYEKVG